MHPRWNATKVALRTSGSRKDIACRRHRRALLLALLLCLPVNAWSQSSTDEELYTRACAACHGADGAGRSVEDVGFDTPLPDFTDCEFTSREPDPDWYAVIHQGGPVRAFDRMMPAFGTALASHEIDAILSHVRTFCSNDAWPRGEFNLPRPLFTEKAFPEDEIVVTTAVGAGSPGTVETEFLYEKRFGPTGMLEIALLAGAARPMPAPRRQRPPAMPSAWRIWPSAGSRRCTTTSSAGLFSASAAKSCSRRTAPVG